MVCSCLALVHTCVARTRQHATRVATSTATTPSCSTPALACPRPADCTTHRAPNAALPPSNHTRAHGRTALSWHPRDVTRVRSLACAASTPVVRAAGSAAVCVVCGYASAHVVLLRRPHDGGLTQYQHTHTTRTRTLGTPRRALPRCAQLFCTACAHIHNPTTLATHPLLRRKRRRVLPVHRLRSTTQVPRTTKPNLRSREASSSSFSKPRAMKGVQLCSAPHAVPAAPSTLAWHVCVCMGLTCVRTCVVVACVHVAVGCVRRLARQCGH